MQKGTNFGKKLRAQVERKSLLPDAEIAVVAERAYSAPTGLLAACKGPLYGLECTELGRKEGREGKEGGEGRERGLEKGWEMLCPLFLRFLDMRLDSMLFYMG